MSFGEFWLIVFMIALFIPFIAVAIGYLAIFFWIIYIFSEKAVLWSKSKLRN